MPDRDTPAGPAGSLWNSPNSLRHCRQGLVRLIRVRRRLVEGRGRSFDDDLHRGRQGADNLLRLQAVIQVACALPRERIPVLVPEVERMPVAEVEGPSRRG